MTICRMLLLQLRCDIYSVLNEPYISTWSDLFIYSDWFSSFWWLDHCILFAPWLNVNSCRKLTQYMRNKISLPEPYCQAGWGSPTPPLLFWPYYMSWGHSITKPCTCMNNTSCNQPKVVPEPEIPALKGKEGQCGVADTWAAWQYVPGLMICASIWSGYRG